MDQNAIDSAAMLSVALEPYGLRPSEISGDVNKRLAPLAKQQITARKAAATKSYTEATEAMKQSLDEMGQRIHAVAEDKAMNFRLAPPTLATVEEWVRQVSAK